MTTAPPGGRLRDDADVSQRRVSRMGGHPTSACARFTVVADSVRKIEAEALKLPAKERARVAERLLASLEGEADPESQRLWLEEAEQRLDELFGGKAKGIPAERVFKKARSA